MFCLFCSINDINILVTLHFLIMCAVAIILISFSDPRARAELLNEDFSAGNKAPGNEEGRRPPLKASRTFSYTATPEKLTPARAGAQFVVCKRHASTAAQPGNKSEAPEEDEYGPDITWGAHGVLLYSFTFLGVFMSASVMFQEFVFFELDAVSGVRILLAEATILQITMFPLLAIAV